MKDFKIFLLHQNLTKNTIDAYSTAVSLFLKALMKLQSKIYLLIKQSL